MTPLKLGGSSTEERKPEKKFTPASIGPKQVLPPKEIPTAVPYAPEVAQKAQSGDIWGDEDIAIEFDSRKRPEVQVCVFQRVTSEDIFLGMGTKDPGRSILGQKVTFLESGGR